MSDSEGNPVYEQLYSGKTPSVVTQFGVPISATQALKGMKAGESFLVDNKKGRASVISAAWRLDISVSARKEGDKFRITRLK